MRKFMIHGLDCDNNEAIFVKEFNNELEAIVYLQSVREEELQKIREYCDEDGIFFDEEEEKAYLEDIWYLEGEYF